MDARRPGILSVMGVQIKDQPKLYWWHISSLMREFQEQQKFQAAIAGAKMK